MSIFVTSFQVNNSRQEQNRYLQSVSKPVPSGKKQYTTKPIKTLSIEKCGSLNGTLKMLLNNISGIIITMLKMYNFISR